MDCALRVNTSTTLADKWDELITLLIVQLFCKPRAPLCLVKRNALAALENMQGMLV